MVLDKFVEIIGIIAVLSVLLTATVKYQATETYQEAAPLAYQVVDSRIVDRPVWFGLWHSKQAQVIIRNIDNESGSFAVNFIFKNDVDLKTATQKADISPGDAKAISADFPLSGNVSVQASVLPGAKYVEKTRTVTKEKPLLDPNALSWFPVLSKV
jgi:hypothetical protein